ncbi:MAG: hypothetical protein Q7T25_10625 [Sideroxyarcus sp.]|nr:hypothetical protein [Sideroxyarcus sp.]
MTNGGDDELHKIKVERDGVSATGGQILRCRFHDCNPKKLEKKASSD